MLRRALSHSCPPETSTPMQSGRTGFGWIFKEALLARSAVTVSVPDTGSIRGNLVAFAKAIFISGPLPQSEAPLLVNHAMRRSCLLRLRGSARAPAPQGRRRRPVGRTGGLRFLIHSSHTCLHLKAGSDPHHHQEVGSSAVRCFCPSAGRHTDRSKRADGGPSSL
jgi:hypothetical protein